MVVMDIERLIVGRVNIKSFCLVKVPYKLRKVREKDLYWVIDNNGKYYCTEALRKDVAENLIVSLSFAHGMKQNELIRKFISII